jgi:hypothetical protein
MGVDLLISSFAARPVRSTIRENPGADSGAPRSRDRAKLIEAKAEHVADR